MRVSYEKGNVLFLILIAVVLFAALSYAVTQSSRGGSSAASEQADLQASRLMNYSAMVKTAIMRLKLREGATVGDIYYNSDIYKRISGSPAPAALGSPADPSLYLFHPDGGGLSEMTFEDIAVDCSSCPTAYIRPGHMLMAWVNAQWLGTSADDAAITFFGMNQGVCEAINRKVGISGIPQTSMPFTSTVIGINFDGSPYGATPTTNGQNNLTNGSSGVEGHNMFCIEDTALSRYVFIDIFEEN